MIADEESSKKKPLDKRKQEESDEKTLGLPDIDLLKNLGCGG